MKIYTKKGDDGTTGLFYGGRVRKDSDQPSAYGVVDEAQAILGVARVEADRGSELGDALPWFALLATLAVRAWVSSSWAPPSIGHTPTPMSACCRRNAT